MKKILLSVEGQTEESFVKQLLQPLFGTECFLQPVVLTTSRSPQGKAYKGGVGTYAKIRDEVQRLCRDTSAVVITTMYDFYGLPKYFPSLHSVEANWTPLQKVQFLEGEFAKDISDIRFVPYLSLHEFEALLFSDVNQIVSFLKQRGASRKGLDKLKAIALPPEEIDDQYPPSKRIEDAFGGYQKVTDGILVAQKIGVGTMLARCPHFRQWVETLQQRCQSDD